MLRRAYKPLKIMKSVLDVCSVPATKVRENQSEMDGRTHTNNSPQQDTHGHHWVSARAMSAHFFTSPHPCLSGIGHLRRGGKAGAGQTLTVTAPSSFRVSRLPIHRSKDETLTLPMVPLIDSPTSTTDRADRVLNDVLHDTRCYIYIIRTYVRV